MKFYKKDFEFANAIKKEWIITNGLGGFSSSTIIGANTRKYHGLLVAPLNPPAQRYLVVSKVDESIMIDNKVYNLYTNMCKDYISDGYKKLISFEKQEMPIFTFNVCNINIKKTICMEYGKNISMIVYEIKNSDKKAKLTLTPLINYRDFHSTSYNRNFQVNQYIKKNLVDIVIDNSENHIYMNCTDGKYIKKENEIFKNMYYIEEENRGLASIEDHSIPGSYEIEVNPNEEKCITFICSLNDSKIEKKDGLRAIKNEKNRIKKLVEKSNLIGDEDLIKKYIIATDNFIVSRKNLLTLIAGYPWFLDWGRDAFISFEGVVLKTKRFDVARKILLTFTKDIKQGLVPNGYSESENKPLYNSVDSSLLLFEQVKKYINYTGDYTFIYEKIYDKLKMIISNYKNGIDLDNNNIYMDDDYLISAGSIDTQNTWMDVKIGNYAVTPRNGKQVEINAMWYNSLMIMKELATKFNDDIKIINEYEEIANNVKRSFNAKFYNEKAKCLFDVIGDSKIRPNQLFALALSYPIIDTDTDVAIQILNTVTKKLLNSYGLKTLAKGDEHYTEIYGGDQYRRDISYHQGITWPWLLGIYNDAYLNIISGTKDIEKNDELKAKYERFVQNLKKNFYKELDFGKTIGSISELYDSRKPYESKGAFAQCWSVAEVFRIII